MKPSGHLSRWLFSTIAGTFVEGTTLYISVAQVAQGELQLPESATVEDGTLTVGYSIAEGHVYPMCTQREVKRPYVMYDSIEVLYDSTKDGNEPTELNARVLCVHKTSPEVQALADSVEDLLNNAYIKSLDACCYVTSRRLDYDAQDGDFLEELRINVRL